MRRQNGFFMDRDRTKTTALVVCFNNGIALTLNQVNSYSLNLNDSDFNLMKRILVNSYLENCH